VPIFNNHFKTPPSIA